MKKVFLSLAVLASVAMVSCNKKAASEGENGTNDSVPAADAAQDNATVENVEVADTIWLNDTTAVVGADTLVIVKA